MAKLKKQLLYAVLIAVLVVGIVSVAFALGNAPDTANAAEIEEQPYALLAATIQSDCEHQFEETQIVPAKCTEQGYTLYTCSLCGETKKDKYTQASGHDYVELPIAATCTTKGYDLYTCQKCGDTYKQTTSPELGHRFVEIVVPANCTHRGYTTHFCTVCGYEYSDSYENETGHL